MYSLMNNKIKNYKINIMQEDLILQMKNMPNIYNKLQLMILLQQVIIDIKLKQKLMFLVQF